MTVLRRRPISELTVDEWAEYIRILRASKNYTSEYSVFLQEDNGSDVTRLLKTPEPVKLYDLFIWQHHYAAKDNENKDPNCKPIIINICSGVEAAWERYSLA